MRKAKTEIRKWKIGASSFLISIFYFLPVANAFATTVQGTVKDAGGTALSSGTLILRLSQEGTVSDPALLIIQPVVQCSITSGAIAAGCAVRGNDTISPAGTFYRVRLITTTGQELLPERKYTISGTTWDIGTATPLASDTVAATAYQIVQDEGTNLTQQTKLNFTGAGVACSNDSTNARTNCSVTGGGAGSTHQIDAVNLIAQDPINFQDTAEIDFTNPAAGNLQAALKAASVAGAKLAAGYIDGVGDFAAALCGTNQILEDQGAAWACIATPTGGGANHNLLSATHPDTVAAAPVLGDLLYGNATPAWTKLAGNTTTTKQFLSQTGTGTVSAAPAWAQPAFADLSGAATKAQLPAATAYEDEPNIFTLAGGLTMDNQLGLRLREATVNGTEYVEHRAPAALAANATFTWFAPAAGFIRSDATGSLSAAAASGVGTCGANLFVTALADNAAPTCTQPSFSSLSGTATKAQLPAATAYEDEPNIFTLAGGLTMDNQLGVRLREGSAGGVNFLEHRAPATLAADGTFTWFAPVAGFIRSDATGGLSAAAASGTGSCTNQFPRTLNDNAAPTCADVAPADFASQTANTVLAGPSSGVPADPTFRSLVDADIPAAIARDSEITLPNLQGGASPAQDYNFGAATMTRVETAGGVPLAAECDAAAEVGSVRMRSDANAANASHYVCSQTSATPTFAWELTQGGGAATVRWQNFGWCNGAVGLSVTRVIFGMGHVATTDTMACNTGSAIREFPVSFAVNGRNLRCRTATAGSAGDSCTLYVNGVASALTCSFSGVTVCQDSTNVVNVNATDTWSVRATNDATTDIADIDVAIEFRPQ